MTDTRDAAEILRKLELKVAADKAAAETAREAFIRRHGETALRNLGRLSFQSA